MVLQKSPHHAIVWGYGDKIGSNVTVTLSGFTAVTAVVNGNKTWNVKLPAVSDKKNHTLTAKSDNAMITLSDILFGDVWLCSGESNMKFTLDMVGSFVYKWQAMSGSVYTSYCRYSCR